MTEYKILLKVVGCQCWKTTKIRNLNGEVFLFDHLRNYDGRNKEIVWWYHDEIGSY